MYALECEDDEGENDDDMEYIDINDLPDDQQQYFLEQNGYTHNQNDEEQDEYQHNPQNKYHGHIQFHEISGDNEDNYIQEGESDYEDDLLDVYRNGGNEEDIANYQGIHMMQKDPDQLQMGEEEKYQCPETGAHFEFLDMCHRLKKMQKRRAMIDKVI